MEPELFSADLAKFLEMALGVQLADPEQSLNEDKLREIAGNAGLTEEDWKHLCEKLKKHLAKGKNHLKFANYIDAVTDLELAAAIAPYRADVLVECGKANLGRWKQTGNRRSRDRAETLFRKCLEIEPDHASAAEQLSILRETKPAPRIRKRMATKVVVCLLVGGISLWVAISARSEKVEELGVDPMTKDAVSQLSESRPAPVLRESPANQSSPNRAYVTITVNADYMISRTVVDPALERNLTWNVYHNGRHKLSRNAINETAFTYFANKPGFYTVYVTAFIDDAYRVVSNVIFYEVKGEEDPKALAD